MRRLTILSLLISVVLGLYFFNAVVEYLSRDLRDSLVLIPLMTNETLTRQIHRKPHAATFRKEPWNNRQLKIMRKNFMKDDYNYCVKTAPFLGPYPYINASANPCWYRKADDKLLCVPKFYMAGFSKCGTTDLFWRIAQHPQVIKGAPKEPHWFDYQRYFQGQDSIDTYAEKFDLFSTLIQSDVRDHRYNAKITGDFTPSYAWSSLYWRCYEGNEGFDEPKYTNADVIHRLYPMAKIIFSLRNPADRLYSRFLSWAGSSVDPAYKDPTPETFHALASQAVDMYEACFRSWSPRHCAYNGTLYALTRLRLQEGMYSVFLQDWLHVFPKDQILVIRFEDYVKDVANHLERIFDFLDLAPLSKKRLDAIHQKELRNKGKRYSVGSMMTKTRKMLESFYQPFLKPLPSLLENKNLVWV